MTYDRFSGVVPPENIRIVTGADYRTQVAGQLPQLKPRQI